MTGRLSRLQAARNYAAGLACVALAAAVRWSLTPLIGTRYPYLLQFVAVLASARYFGFGPAMAGLLLGTSPLVFGVEFIVHPSQAEGLRFWISVVLIYALAISLISVLDRHRRLRSEVKSTSELAEERTRQLAVEVEKREREQRFSAQLRAIVESSDDAVIYKDLDNIIRSWNFGAEQIYGYKAEEIIGKSIYTLVPDDRQAEEREIAERIRHGGRVKHFETVRLRKDGTAIQVAMTVSPILDAAGRMTGVSHISRDITERKQFEEQLRQTQKLESLGVLAGGIAHDFNNLLTGIMGNAGLAIKGLPEGHPARQSIAQVLAASDRAALLVRQMLAYAGKGRKSVTRLNLSEHVAQIAPLVATSLGKQVALELDLAPNLPEVEADPAQIQQVVMNLVINGAEAIGPGPGTLAVATFAREIEFERQVVLQVRDTGSGMDEQTCARIFDPFFTTKFAGRGLGLSAVLGIIRGHRGYISVDTAPGKGSTFTVSLPVADAASNGDGQNGVRGYGKVLVVDDEDVVRNLARFSLQQAGYTVETANNRASAAELLRAHSRGFDAVLLDLTMTGAQDVLRDAQAACPDARIVVSSTLIEAEALQWMDGRGVSAHLQRPYTAPMLARKIKEVLKRGPAAS